MYGKQATQNTTHGTESREMFVSFLRQRQPRKNDLGDEDTLAQQRKSNSNGTTTSVRRQSTDPSGDGNGIKVYSHSDAAEAAASEQTAAAGQQQLLSRFHSAHESTTSRLRRVSNSFRVDSIFDLF